MRKLPRNDKSGPSLKREGRSAELSGREDGGKEREELSSWLSGGMEAPGINRCGQVLT